MTPAPTTGYRIEQVALHWFVAALVVFQFFTGDNMTALFRAAQKGLAAPISTAWTPVHIVIGGLILAAMLRRLMLRRRFGAPPAPATEAPWLRWLAGAVHAGLYGDMILAPIVGLIAYFGVSSIAWLHELMSRQILIVLVVLHVAGAVWHQVYWRDDVLARMLKPLRA